MPNPKARSTPSTRARRRIDFEWLAIGLLLYEWVVGKTKESSPRF
jgi:hypothetical protein